MTEKKMTQVEALQIALDALDRAFSERDGIVDEAKGPCVWTERADGSVLMCNGGIGPRVVQASWLWCPKCGRKIKRKEAPGANR